MLVILKSLFPASMVMSGLLIMAIGATLGGCTKERVVEVDTPRGGVTVDRDKRDGSVDVNVDVGRDKKPVVPVAP